MIVAMYLAAVVAANLIVTAFGPAVSVLTAFLFIGLNITNGLRFHYGRAGTMEKVAHAIEVGADSLDSALPMWTEGRWRTFVQAITCGPTQTDFFRESA